jgi:hypothetical protein
VFGLAQWRSALRFADDRPAWNRRRHAHNLGHLFTSPGNRGRLGFVVRRVLDREQDTLIGFIGKLPQQLSLLTVLLDEGQFAVSDGGEGLDMVMSSAAAQAADQKRRRYRQSLEAFPERRDRQYRSGFEFRRPQLLRHPAPIARRC